MGPRLFDLINPEGIREEEQERSCVVACTEVPVIAREERPATHYPVTTLPIAGKSPSARHASHSGAVAGHRCYGKKVLRYLAILDAAGASGISDFQAFEMMDVIVSGVNAINSIRNSLGDLVEHTGCFDDTAYGTKRGRYRLSAAGRHWRER